MNTKQSLKFVLAALISLTWASSLFGQVTANTGGPYTVSKLGGSLSLDGSGSISTTIITAYDWDLDNDGSFGDTTGVTPASIPVADLMALWDMTIGDNTIALRVTDSAPNIDTTTTTVTLIAAAIYEPFAYGDFDATPGTMVEVLDGTGGTLDTGLDGTWTANSTSNVVAGSLEWGSTTALLDTTGNAIGDLSGGQNRFGGTRAVSASALADNGLLDDGAILWFSAEMGYDTGGNVTNSRLALALGNDQFNSGNFNYWINDDGAQLGSGVGVVLGRFSNQNGRTQAVEFRDAASGDGTSGNINGSWVTTTSRLGGGEHRLLVGKITWGETPEEEDLIEIFQPATDLAFLTNSVSVLTGTWDQTTFDTLSWARGDKVVMDEIRFGATYNDVIAKDLVADPDVDPPTPDPAAFAVVPTAIDDSTVTMTATVAHDPSGVEYLFTETTGFPGATSSGWQDSPNYTDVGLSPSTMYTYTVQTRDKSVGQNTGTASAGEDVTTPAVDFDPPTPDPMTFASNPAAVSNTELTMSATTATDNTYDVEYNFVCTVGGGPDSGWIDSTTFVATGLTPNTNYTYTVAARDTGPLNNEGTASDPESTSTLPTDDTPPSPDPATWATVPTPTSDTTVAMMATTATDDQYDVEYFFTNFSFPDGSHDSGWQDSPSYTDTGLAAFTSYTYGVKVRDKSYAQNEAAPSDPLPAVTDADPSITTPTLSEGLFYTVASQNAPASDRTFDVSVVPGKAIFTGTGNIPNGNQTGPLFNYSYFGDGTVLDYRFFLPDSNVPTAYAMGDAGIISDVTTPDTSLSNLNQADVWTTTDPGYDFMANPADFTSPTGFHSIQIFNTPGVLGTIDISGMNEGIIYFVYGGYRLRPELNLVMSGPGQTDVILENAGDGDNANNHENYISSVSFLNAGNYDTISYDVTYVGNSGGGSHGEFWGVVVDGEAVFGDYATWAALYAPANLTDPNANLDGDGYTNNEERLLGLDPTDPSSVNPYPVGIFESTTYTFSYTRRDDALTGLNYTIWTASDAKMWVEDDGAVQVVGDAATTANNMVETIEVTLSPALLVNPVLYVKVQVGDFPTLLSENFEAGDGNFSTTTDFGTAWEHGDPDSVGEFGGSVLTGNGGSTNCWGTNLGNFSVSTAERGYYADSTVTYLRSVIIDLTAVAGAELTFAEALDIEAGDTAVVNIIDDTTDTIIDAAIYEAIDASDSSADWNIANGGSAIDLTPYVGQAIRIEWCFVGFGGATDDYMGWYIDDVIVQQVAGP